MEAIVIPVSFFLAVFAILYVFFTTRNKERLALIEKGAEASIFKKDPGMGKYNLLKWGIFLIGLAAGVISGFMLSKVINEVVAFFTGVLLFGGLALIIAHFVTNKMVGKDN